MEDALFSLLLFTAFYCLYSKMFMPKTTQQPAVTVVTTAAVQQPTTQTVHTTAGKVTVTPVARSIALAVVAPAAATTPYSSAIEAVETSTPGLEFTHDLEPDRDRDRGTSTVVSDFTPAAHTTRPLGFASTSKPKRSTRTRQTKQPAIAFSKGSESRP